MPVALLMYFFRCMSSAFSRNRDDCDCTSVSRGYARHSVRLVDQRFGSLRLLASIVGSYRRLPTSVSWASTSGRRRPAYFCSTSRRKICYNSGQKMISLRRDWRRTSSSMRVFLADGIGHADQAPVYYEPVAISD